jgi:hypothetical protein
MLFHPSCTFEGSKDIFIVLHVSLISSQYYSYFSLITVPTFLYTAILQKAQCFQSQFDPVLEVIALPRAPI